ncbi:trypsin-1-like isoform X1 [Biomphalaria glabrata]|uniref:Trypsin-1-like isoform X1 n=1 Tax=Biomphalaria glabrata TaxID=6526 RepID=A0A9W3AT13_BIOGL|nr:trypsin-1-like isoform X1 [Biomphalaria glabrata]XP_055890387.1 trypsin-1-like isoform X1 [Biomphalaria glabrata]
MPINVYILILMLVCTNVLYGMKTTCVQNTNLNSELKVALGPYYSLLITAYWRYLTGPCDVLTARLSSDLATGYLRSFCAHVTQCPEKSSCLSCSASQTVVHIRKACCKETSCRYGTVFPTAKVVGGQRAFRGEFPWIAMLLSEGTFLCGCVILDKSHALTAAHCFDRLDNKPNIEVLAGRYQYDLQIAEAGNQRVKVKSYEIHEKYRVENVSNDIAILLLATPLVFNTFVTPVCLPRKEDQPEQVCTVAGYGYVNRREPPEVLMKVDLTTYNSTQCLQTFQPTSKPTGALATFLSNGTLCAANELQGGKDTCLGDSGGPLMCAKSSNDVPRYYLFGLVSNGGDCGKAGEPGIYTNIVHFLDWIETKLKRK